jgi:hypothetical protein
VCVCVLIDQHITVAREIMGADIDLLRYIYTITPEGADGDCNGHPSQHRPFGRLLLIEFMVLVPWV